MASLVAAFLCLARFGEDFLDSRLLIWIAAISLVELFPVQTAGSYFSVADPILLALAFSHRPQVVFVIVLVASWDPREIRAQIPLRRSLFNRGQCAFSASLAAIMFSAVAVGSSSWPTLLVACVLATGAHYAINISLVGSAHALADGISVRRAINDLLLDAPVKSVLGYLSFGLLGLLLSRVYASGPENEWLLLVAAIPILVLARQSFVHLREYQAEAEHHRARASAFRTAASQIEVERSDERTRLAESLHDEVIPVLEAINLNARAAAQGRTTSRDMSTISEMARDGLSQLRRIVSGLRSSPLQDGLTKSVRDLLLNPPAGLKVVQSISPRLPSLPQDVELAIFQIIREAFSNAIRHSRASTIRVTLCPFGASGIEAMVSDDGRGLTGAATDNHFGLEMMSERAAKVGANLAVASKGGVSVRLRWDNAYESQRVSPP